MTIMSVAFQTHFCMELAVFLAFYFFVGVQMHFRIHIHSLG